MTHETERKVFTDQMRKRRAEAPAPLPEKPSPEVHSPDSPVSGNHPTGARGVDHPVLTGQVPAYPEPPECPAHKEVQHRDGNPPWCNSCGWRHGVISLARKIGP